jgi:SOS-response transcriptional repressor LexA
MRERLGLASKSNVHRLLEQLSDRGYVDRDKHRARAIRVYDVSRRSRAETAAPVVDLTIVPMSALLGEIARRTNGQVRM